MVRRPGLVVPLSHVILSVETRLSLSFVAGCAFRGLWLGVVRRGGRAERGVNQGLQEAVVGLVWRNCRRNILILVQADVLRDCFSSRPDARLLGFGYRGLRLLRGLSGNVHVRRARCGGQGLNVQVVGLSRGTGKHRV